MGIFYKTLNTQMQEEAEKKVREIVNGGAKTHKGRLHLKKYESKVEEGPRGTLLAKGSKSSQVIAKIFDMFRGIMKRDSK